MEQVEFAENLQICKIFLRKPYHFKFFKRLSSTNFTWFILEYLDPYETDEPESVAYPL